jgi:acetoacetate decarboxylase
MELDNVRKRAFDMPRYPIIADLTLGLGKVVHDYLKD